MISVNSDHVPIIIITAWKCINCPYATATLFRNNLLREKELQHPSVDIREDKTSQSREILAFYKSPQVDWARPLHCILEGKDNIDFYSDIIYLHMLRPYVQKC